MSIKGNVAVFIPHEGCPNQCSFCNQNAITGRALPPTVAQVEKICIEVMNSGKRGCELAFFGGSFTAINPEYMYSLLDLAERYVKLGVFSGIRFSTRPDCIDSQLMINLRPYTITAIELGCQSMDSQVLSLNKRGHSSDDVIKAATLIKSEGIDLGVQMMTGLYGDSHEKAVLTAKSLIALEPKTARIYPTVVLPNTYLAQLVQEGSYNPPSAMQSVPLVAELIELFEGSAIDVIRVGLHAEKQLEEDMIAGAYHPAFRELCDNYIMLGRVKRLIKDLHIPLGEIIIQVPKGKLSKMIGQQRKNILELEELGYKAKIKENPQLKSEEIIIEPVMG